jgi:hypothetical protein
LDYWLLYWYHCSEDYICGLINLLRKKVWEVERDDVPHHITKLNISVEELEMEEEVLPDVIPKNDNQRDYNRVLYSINKPMFRRRTSWNR